MVDKNADKNKVQSDIDEEIQRNVVESEEETQGLEVRVQELEEQVEGLKNQYLRSLADYKNLEHRVENERQRMRDDIKRQTIEKLFPVLDNLDQAEVFNDDPGLQIVTSSFRKALADMGVREIDLLGNEYDPEYAEVVQVVKGKQDDVIVEVLQKAYELNDRVIRHGKVVVSKSEG